MRQNQARRAALLDAAIEVLSRDGSRGLPLRAVDKETAVPTGTASNYFANRDDLLTQAASRVYERLLPDDDTIARHLSAPRDRATYAKVMNETANRVAAFRTGFVALLELRLEATRCPEPREILTRRVRADIDANIAHHRASGLPGDEGAVVLLYLALNWLIVEQLTLPELFSAEEREGLINKAVDRIVTGAEEDPGRIER